MLSLGIYFTTKVNNLGRVFVVLLIRIGLGLALGVMFSSLFHLTGTFRTLVIIFCGAPVGYNTLVFSQAAGPPFHLPRKRPKANRRAANVRSCTKNNKPQRED